MDQVTFFFGGWESVLRVLVVGTLGYASIVVLLRATGKRTLASMNAFDFIVTVAIGSAYGRVLTAKGTPLADAVAAFALLVVLQYAVAWLKVRSRRFGQIITGSPTILLYRGQYLHPAMQRERVSEEEVRAAIREQRLGSADEVEAVVLETAGTLAVIPRSKAGDRSALPPLPTSAAAPKAEQQEGSS